MDKDFNVKGVFPDEKNLNVKIVFLEIRLK